MSKVVLLLVFILPSFIQPTGPGKNILFFFVGKENWIKRRRRTEIIFDFCDCLFSYSMSREQRSRTGENYKEEGGTKMWRRGWSQR